MTYASALDLGHRIEKGAADPRDLIRETLERAERADRGMIVHFLEDRELAEADAAAARAKAGIRRSRLDGVPIVWKDNIDLLGAACEAGSPLLEGRRPAEDAPVVKRGARAGLVSFAKTGMTELAFSGLGVNPWSGTPGNSMDKSRCPGGSSAGSGVAVGGGYCTLAAGSDTGGSVRIPAAWNGIVGLKTTAGLIPLEGVVPLSWSYDTVGPMARTVAEAAALFEIFALEAPIDLRAGGKPRLAAVEGAVLAGIEPDVRTAYERVLDTLAKAGLLTQRMSSPALEETLRTASPVGPEAYSLWGAKVEAEYTKVYARIAERIVAAREISAPSAAACRLRLSQLQHDFLNEIAGFDALVMPTVAIAPPPIADVEEDADFYHRANIACLSLPSLGNRLGLCAITIPAGSTTGALSLPFGLSIVARPFEERRLLQIAAALEPLLQ